MSLEMGPLKNAMIKEHLLTARPETSNLNVVIIIIIAQQLPYFLFRGRILSLGTISLNVASQPEY